MHFPKTTFQLRYSHGHLKQKQLRPAEATTGFKYPTTKFKVVWDKLTNLGYNVRNYTIGKYTKIKV
jgi:hypothetical protein